MGAADDPHRIESHLHEARVFPPPPAFASRAHVDAAEYERLAAWARRDPDAFWAEVARGVDWMRPWERVLDDSGWPFCKWFVGGQLNLSANCLDRHLATRGDKPAIIWEGEPG